MAAFTDLEKLADFVGRRKICSQRQLAACLKSDKNMARILSDDPDGTKHAMVNEALRQNRMARDRAEAEKRAAAKQAREYEKARRWPNGPHPDEPDWEDIGVPVDGQGCLLGIGDD